MEDINEALIKVNCTDLVFTDAQKNILSLASNVMEYFSEATIILQREDSPTLNRVIPVVDSLENAVKQMNHRENAFVNALCEVF